ncbi:hypothetical protein TNCV_3470041 [Trichonephila clavipes]|nr:hypothetical protein TNCV_3470041 [Trichonephila clavipes]
MLNSCVMHHYNGPAPGIMVRDGIGYHSRTLLVRISAIRVNRGVVILERRTLSRKESLKNRVKMICEDTLIIVANDHFSQDKDRSQSMGQRIASHTLTETPTCFTVGIRQRT